MPRKRGYTPPADPAIRQAMALDGSGFYAPMPPSDESVLAYLRLYCQEREEWDEPPELGVLRSPYDGQVTGYPLPILEASWDSYVKPGALLRKLVDVLWHQGRTDHALVRHIDRTMLPDMVGMYFRHESWSPPKGSPYNHRRADGAVPRLGYDLQQTKDKRESRGVLAVMVDGTRLRVSHFRDTPQKFNSAAYQPLATPTHKTTPIFGDTPPLLQELAYGLIKNMRPEYANEAPEDTE